MRTYTRGSSFRLAEWLVDPDLGSISNGERVVELEPRIMDLLVFLARNPIKVHSRDDLIEHVWGTVVSDSAVSRGIAILRKALGDDSSSPRYIKTISKVGYQLVADVHESSSDDQNKASLLEKLSTIIDARHRINWRWALSILVGMLAILSISTQFSGNPFADKTHKSSNVIIPLTTIFGNEDDPVFAPDGSWLAFAHKEINSGDWDILIKHVDTGITYNASNGKDTIDRHPDWSKDGKYLVYNRRNNASGCEFVILDVQAKSEVKEVDSVPCNGSSLSPDVIWGADNNTLFFTDTEIEPAGNPFIDPYKVFRYSIDTGMREQLTNPPEIAGGDYRIALSPDESRLAILRASEWQTIQILVLDLTTNKADVIADNQPNVIAGLPYVPLDFSWCDTQNCLLVKGMSGQIGKLDISTGAFESITNIGTDLFSPVPVPGKDQVAMVMGKSIIGNIMLWNNPMLIERQVDGELLIGSTKSDKFAKYSNAGDRIAFISERSGSDQIWIRDESGAEFQLTKEIIAGGRRRHLEWSKNDQFILGLAGGRAILVNINTGEEEFLTSADIKIASPIWSNDEESIIFSSNLENDWQLWEAPFKGDSLRKLTHRGAYLASLSSTGEYLYYSKYRRKGVWRMSVKSGDEEIVIPEFFGGRPWQLFDTGIYYPATDKTLNRDATAIKYYDIQNKQTKSLLQFNQRKHFIFSVSPDQKSFLVTVTQPQETQIIAIHSK